MHSDENGPLISSEVLEPSDKALIPDLSTNSPLLKRDGLSCGHGLDATDGSQAGGCGCHCPQQRLGVLGHSRAIMSPNSQAAQDLGLHEPDHGMSF